MADTATRAEDGPPPSPVTRLVKGYANQAKDGPHMVDLVDFMNGQVICHCVYEPYADEILAALVTAGLRS